MSRPSRSRVASALLATFVMAGLPFVSSTEAGQTEGGRLTVTVRDNAGIVPGALVNVTRRDGGGSAHLTSDDRGTATFTGLAPGTYDVRVSFPGFADTEKRPVEITAGEPRAVEVVLSSVQFSSQVTVTTANRREQLLLNVAEPTVLLDATQISDTSARTAKDLLSEQSGAGIQVQAGGGQGYVSLNGVPNSGVLVLIDGRRYLGKDANGDFNLEDLALTDIDRVEVVKGAGSALYGSDALGGVINFVTRRSKDPGVTSRTDLTVGSYADRRINESAGWRASRGGVRLGAGYRTYDGFDLSVSNPQTIGQPPSKWKSLDVNADARLTDKALLSLFADWSRRNIKNYFFSGPTQLASTVYDSRRKLDRYAVSPALDVQASSRASVSVAFTRGKYRRDETRVYTVSGRVVPQAPWREWNDEVKVTGRYTWTAFGQDHPLQGGYERRQEKLSRSTLNVTDPHRSIDVAWIQQEVGIGAPLRLAGGFRYDRYSDFGGELSPKISAVFAPAERHRVRASYGHGFRPPYFGELYLNTPPVFVGNPDLKPETANTFNVGYSFASPHAEFTADLFQVRVRNGITFNLSRLPYTYGNLQQYTSKGVSLALSAMPVGGFVPSLAYTYNRREDDAGVQIGGYPVHSVYVKLLWTQARTGLRANLRAQILGAVPPAEDGTYQPGYQVWNAQLARNMTAGRHNISVFAQIGNVFDRRDIFLRDQQGNPIQGTYQVWIAPRTFIVGTTVDLDWTRD